MRDFVRASALAGYGEMAEVAGLDAKSMLRAAHLPESILEQPDGLVSYSHFLHLLNLSAQESSDRFFGLKLGLHQGVSVFGPLLYLIRNAPTVLDALRELRQFFHIHMGAADFEISVQGKQVQISYHVLDARQSGLVQGVELAIGVGVRLMQTLCGPSWALQAVMFEHSAQHDPSQYQKLLGVVPHFNGTANGLLFDVKLLAQPLSEADEALHTLIRSHLNTLDRLSDKELPAYVSALLRNMLDRGRVTIEDIAQYMAMSRRTLQRRLTACGTSFQKVLDETRQNLAQRYLRDSNLQMTQLADLLGYSDLSAFSRAFTKWFGVPPSQWRMGASN